MNQIIGFDILKFFLATMLVALHTKGFSDVEIIRRITDPFIAIAVPVFFILSSYFIFRKMDIKGYSWHLYKPFVKRLLLLYSFYFVVSFPIMLVTKWYGFYINYGFVKLCVRFITGLFFSQTYPGGWFLTSLVVATFIIFLLRKFLQISNGVLLVLAILFQLYLVYHASLPFWLQKAYIFIQTHIFPVVELTPIRGFIWCAVGAVLAKSDLMFVLSRSLRIYGSLIATVVFYSFFHILPLGYQYVYTPFFGLAMILLAFNINLRPNDVYLYLRKASILIYLVHFYMLKVFNYLLPPDRLHIFYYISVLFSTLMVAFIILKLENCKYFSILKFSH